MRHRIIVKTIQGKSLGEITTFKNLTYTKRLNNYGPCSFDIPAKDSKAKDLIILRRTVIYVYRDGVLVWSGITAIRNGTLTENGNDMIKIVAYDWFELLMGRNSGEVIYSGVDAGAIAWDLIDRTNQVNDTGITEGTIESTQLRDREYFDSKIGELISNLTNVINGFDFEITNDKVFNVYSFKGTYVNLWIKHGINATNTTIEEDFSSPVNSAIVKGESNEEEDELVREIVNNNESISKYGLYEEVSTEYDISDIDTFVKKGDAILRKYSEPTTTISFDLISNSFEIINQLELGDMFNFEAKKGIYDIKSAFRLYSTTITESDSGEVSISLSCSNFKML